MMTRRRISAAAGALALLVVAACGGGAESGAESFDWKAPYDESKIPAQVASFQTYGLPDDWANYGELIKAFCKKYGATKCEHKDTDMGSAEEIQKFDLEKSNPVGTVSDIGALWGTVAEEKGVVPPYLPPNADRLKPEQKAKSGGWVNTFAGVIAFTVNTDKVKNPPRTWADLLKPEYKGLINIPTGGGTGQAMVMSAAYAFNGSVDNLDPAYEFFRKLKQSGNIANVDATNETLSRGQVGIWVQYDFLAVKTREELKAKGVPIEAIIPSDGSVYAPSSMMINKYNTAKADFTKAFTDFALSDEGQLLFAKFGARPIRFINGDLEIPSDVRRLWLPDSAYANTRSVDFSKVSAEQMVSDWEAKVLS